MLKVTTRSVLETLNFCDLMHLSDLKHLSDLIPLVQHRWALGSIC
jgi:hypothetical protein